jgi:glycosyltransferase involved in cell wall biosynthesis
VVADLSDQRAGLDNGKSGPVKTYGIRSFDGREKEMSLQPIKILHLIPTLLSGGAERQLANVVRGTSPGQFDHVVCVIDNAEFFGPGIRDAGYRVNEFKISEKRPFLRAASRFRAAINTEKPDIIHSRLYDANIAARLASFPGAGIPIITSLELADYEPEIIRIGGWNPHKVRGLKAIDKITASLARPYYVPCSYFVKNSYQRNFGIDEAKTQVIYNSVDPQLLSASEEDVKKIREELGLPPDAFIYLNVGRLDPQKNHKLLFQAFRKVANEVPQAYLLLAGVGRLEDELKKLALEIGIDKKTFFLGRRSDVGALLELADVFVFPSFFEGHPVALLEAMFKSLPSIASRIEVFEEVIDEGETGLLVDPDSADELTGAMVELYENGPLRKSLAEKALSEARAKYDISVIIKQWEGFYRKVNSLK